MKTNKGRFIRIVFILFLLIRIFINININSCWCLFNILYQYLIFFVK